MPTTDIAAHLMPRRDEIVNVMLSGAKKFSQARVVNVDGQELDAVLIGDLPDRVLRRFRFNHSAGIWNVKDRATC